MITSNQAFDMLPYMVDIYDKLQLDNYRNEVIKKYERAKNKGEQISSLDAGIDVVKYIIKNSNKVKEEFFVIVAIFEGKEVDEVKAQPLTKTLITFKEMFSDKELNDFFRSAMQ